MTWATSLASHSIRATVLGPEGVTMFHQLPEHRQLLQLNQASLKDLSVQGIRGVDDVDEVRLRKIRRLQDSRAVPAQTGTCWA